MKNNVIKYLFIILFVIINYYSNAQTTDANLKTAYIYNFATYIKWESEDDIDSFKIGVFGKDTAIFYALSNMGKTRLLKNKPIKIISFSNVEDINKTQILYVVKDRNSEINEIFEKITGENILLITNDCVFNKSMINFIYDNEKLQFELNEENITDGNFVILPKLTALKKSKSELKKLYFKTDELLESEKEKVKIQKNKIVSQKKEISEQNLIIDNQKKNIILQQKNIDSQKGKLNNLVEENKTQQRNLDLKIKLLDIKEKERKKQGEIIRKQQTEINKQKNNVAEQNSVLEKQKSEITSRQNKIQSLNSVINNQLEEIQTQRLVLILFIALIILILGLVFYIYRGYRIKKESNKILVEKNTEITQQKEEILTQAEHLEIVNKELEKLSIVARETDNAVIIMDSEGNYEWVNQGFIHLYELSLNEYISSFGGNIINASLNPDIQEMIQYCIEKKKPVNFESFFLTKSNKEIWVQTTLTPIIVDNKIKKLVAIDSDITNIKEYEEKILQQKDEIEAQRDDIETKRVLAIKQRDEISRQKQDITDSIQYAKRIQTAVYPSDDFINQILDEYFIFNKPKGIVGGDFYWISELKGKTIIAVGDCTGHGVPGGFMSMLGITFLNKIVNEKGITKPSEILNRLRINIIESLHQKGEFGEVDDGMDISLISVDKKNNLLQYAGAMNSLYIISTDVDSCKLKEIKADRISICISRLANQPFINHEIDIKKGDTVYLSTDGYLDQFGGPEGSKFKAKNFRQMLVNLHKLSMPKQEKALRENFENWIGDNMQIDDILVMGIRM